MNQGENRGGTSREKIHQVRHQYFEYPSFTVSLSPAASAIQLSRYSAKFRADLTYYVIVCGSKKEETSTFLQDEKCKGREFSSSMQILRLNEFTEVPGHM